MPLNDPPRPPTYAALQAWAGPGRVVRARDSDVAAWRLPETQKAALVTSGVPLLDGIIDTVTFEATSGHYQLAGHDLGAPSGSSYAAEPDTGHIVVLNASPASTKLVNTSIHHWLRSLHLVGTWLAASTAIRRWHEDAAMEETALAELSDLLKQIALLDPAAYGDIGDHETRFWPGSLDRWLY